VPGTESAEEEDATPSDPVPGATGQGKLCGRGDAFKATGTPSKEKYKARNRSKKIGINQKQR